MATSVRFSLTWEVKKAPSTSAITDAQAARTASEAESEKRGVTAYRARPRPCQRDARSTASEWARSGVVSSGSGSIRSLTTRPLVTRSPKRAASVNSASTAGAKWDPKTSEVVVPAAISPADELARDRRRVVGSSEVLLLGQGAALEPLQQRHPERPDHPDLGEVHVGVDQPGQQDPGPQVDHGGRGCAAATGREGAAGRDDPLGRDDAGPRSSS